MGSSVKDKVLKRIFFGDLPSIFECDKKLVTLNYVEIYLSLVHKLQLHRHGKCRSKERTHDTVYLILRKVGKLTWGKILTNFPIFELLADFFKNTHLLVWRPSFPRGARFTLISSKIDINYI